MKYIRNILLLVLFISLHLNVSGMFALSYALFYLSFSGILLLWIFQKGKTGIPLKESATLIVTSLVISLLIRIFIQGNTYGTFCLFAITVCWLLFFVFTAFFKSNRHIEKTVFWCIVISVILEIAFGFGQLFGWTDNDNEFFRLGGSFGSPSAYSAYLSIVSPLILSVLLTYKRIKKADNLYYLLIACFVFILYLLFVAASRGAWLACILGCLLVLNHQYLLLQKLKQRLSTPIRKTIAIACLSIVVLAGAYGLYQVKADSAFGRILVWKVTAVTPHNHWLWGEGVGAFEANYGKWQADYFASGSGTEKERYVADYVTCAYNDFLETAVEQGVVGLLLLVALFYLAFRKKRATNNPVYIGAKSSLLAIIILMFVTFPLKNIPILLYLVFCLAVVLKNENKTQKQSYFTKWFIPIIGLIVAIFGLQNIYGYHLLQEGNTLVLSNQMEKGIKKYEKAENILQNNGMFHFYYASALAMTEQYAKSAEETRKSIQTSSNPSAYILLGNNLYELRKPDYHYYEIVQAYQTVESMMPNKLYPKYILAKFFMKAGYDDQAQIWAKEILATKEKVPTTAAKEIKQEMESFLQSK